MITIDGIEWPIPCEIHRTAEISASEISGLMLDKNYFNDVLGTFMTYEVGLPVPQDARDLYASVYEILTEPVDGHSFILPYNQGTVTITGRVLNVRDTPYKVPGGYYWEGCTFTIVANHPTKSLSLGEVISRGRAPIPPVTSYEDADERYF